MPTWAAIHIPYPESPADDGGSEAGSRRSSCPIKLRPCGNNQGGG